MAVVTVVMEDLGNSLQFTLANGDIFVLNKLNIQTKYKASNDEVYLTDAGGFVDSGENKTIKLPSGAVGSTMGGTPDYPDGSTLFDALMTSIGSVSLGGGGAGGGGNNTWSNTQGNFTATPTVGANTITITGLPFTLEDGHVALGSIKKISSTGAISNISLTALTVSGNVITITDADNFVAGDTVEVVLFGQDKSWDQALDSDIVTVLNQDSEKWTSPEALVALSAVGAVTNRYVIPMEGFKDLSLHWDFTAGGTVTMTLWATNKAAADDSADTDWVDVSGDYLTKTLTGSVEFIEVAKEFFFLKGMIKIITTGTGNSADVIIKKKAL
jgi:hypothetical protein